ncbi:MAG: hypothetical protein KF858_11460 [Candidatus Sumerlaeia bacterium]|nr:hypothetical protein [Candidatus Sumerlaeia bacterium]
MITRCSVLAKALPRMREVLGLAPEDPIAALDLEFREIPYFIVSRSRQGWNEKQGDINTVLLVGCNERGLLADPDNVATTAPVPTRTTLIPWSNVISLTAERA